MKISQKVFWIFFTIMFVTLVLVLNQFVTYYTQQRFNVAIEHINRLQTQVRQLDQLRLALFLPEKRFDMGAFERLVAASSETSQELKQSIAQLPETVFSQLENMDFNLNNFRQSLRELAEVRTASVSLESAIHKILRTLHDAANLHVSDLQLIFNISSFVHHQQYHRLPIIKQYAEQIKADHDELVDKLDGLLELLEKFYLYDLQLADRKGFVETAADNFLVMTQQMLTQLEQISTQRQRMVSQVSLSISVIGLLAAIFYWYRIRLYLRRFLYNQKQVMRAIRTGSNGLQLVPQSRDELGELTGAMKDLSVELKHKKADLLASEQKYRSLVENLSDWIWETDSEQRFTFCSAAGERITGHPSDRILGRKYLTLSQHCEDAAVLEHVKQHFQEQLSFNNIERKILCADGSFRHLIASGLPLFDSEQRFVGFRGVDRDITALVKAREAQELLEVKLQHAQKMESIGRLAGGVAHDFNNILSAIIGYSELILNRLEDDHACYKYVGEIRKSGERASGLTKQLLAFSRKQARKPKNLVLDQEVSQLEDMLQRLVGEQIKLQIEMADNIWPVLMDKSQLEQVIVNLVVNAKDAMSTGGVIDISLSNCGTDCECQTELSPNLPAADYVQLTVSDSGCGIPDEVLQNIFEPFFTTKERDKGTGLGLAMVYGIVTQNHGDVLVSSEVGRGTSFKILLPRSTQQLSQPQVGKEESALRKGGETILFVEDEAALLKMHGYFLQSLGYQVITATDGVEALEKYQQLKQIDLLITDVVMPNMGGIELAEKLFELDSGIKVLYTSGYTDHELFTDGVLQEGVNFIYKPATPMAVVKMLEKILDQ